MSIVWNFEIVSGKLWAVEFYVSEHYAQKQIFKF
jgi:hypothetical protein